MKYFLGITDIEQAKLRYRKLAKQLHPDKGGTAIDFQEMQTEYKEYLLSLQPEQQVVTAPQKNTAAENELISELGKLAKVLIKQQVPQNYLRVITSYSIHYTKLYEVIMASKSADHCSIP